MNQSDTAIIKAIEALTWMVGQDDVLLPFLNMTGASIQDVKDGAASPEFLGAALDFILTSDTWVLSCAEMINVNPEELLTIRAKLPGGEQVHWT